MDILSEVLEALGLRCSDVKAITLNGTHAGGSASTQAYIVMSGRCTLHLGADAPPMELRGLDGFLVVGDADHRIEPGPLLPHTPTRLLRCVYALDRNLPPPVRATPAAASATALAIPHGQERTRPCCMAPGGRIDQLETWLRLRGPSPCRDHPCGNVAPVRAGGTATCVSRSVVRPGHSARAAAYTCRAPARLEHPGSGGIGGFVENCLRGTVSPAGRRTAVTVYQALAHAQRASRNPPQRDSDQEHRGTCGL